MQIDQSNRNFFNHVEEIEEVVPYSNETEELVPNPEMQNSISSSFNPSNLQMHAQATDTTSLKTAQASEFKNAESGACWQVKSSLYTHLILFASNIDYKLLSRMAEASGNLRFHLEIKIREHGYSLVMEFGVYDFTKMDILLSRF